jgi:uncharacterized protein YbcC (UPF0753/DUF2309 family)
MKIKDALLCPDRAAVSATVDAACSAIAPTWPLDRFIAVNPWWGWKDRPFDTSAAQLGRLCGSPMTMPRAYYRAAWEKQQFTERHLVQALVEKGLHIGPATVVAALDQPSAAPAVMPLLSDLADASRDLTRKPAWRSSITHQISQFCAAYFDADQADWHLPHEPTLFAGWRANLVRDRGIALLVDAPQLRQRLQSLPGVGIDAIATVIAALEVPADALETFMKACLLRINGWAAWCAYLRWQARLEGREDTHIIDLLAIRLCWEYLIDHDAAGHDRAGWCKAWSAAAQEASPSTPEAETDLVLQRALEIAYASGLAAEMARPAVPAAKVRPAVQAVFCIDVRSEVLRRALEHVAQQVQTIGFAGFFGLPISYQAIGTAASRPQLPGLLSPALQATDSCGIAEKDLELAAQRRSGLAASKSWQPFGRMPGSAFALVETLGPCYLARLVRRSLPAARLRAASADRFHGHGASLRPVLALTGDDLPEQRAGLAEKVLGAMGMRRQFARVVLLAGHGSTSANNAHAAGLDCGACCGQTGEVNARALAELLNRQEVRALLAKRGLAIPADTWFVAGLHDTTTDEVALFDLGLAPDSHSSDLEQLRSWLDRAGQAARRERAPLLGVAQLASQPQVLEQALRVRSNDWAQTRPEWGLANNAAFIAAPRSRSQAIDLQGRSFLHDYEWQHDSDNSILELIMTAPMVVAHWINMQYYASTVDNARYGSGNKVLHNVVGGHIGVFEGNGGDLRIGLPMQSLHDGHDWVHTPLRLSVFIEAPRERIEAVIVRHQVVRQLVDHQWLGLFRIDSDTNAVESRLQGKWQPVAGAA